MPRNDNESQTLNENVGVEIQDKETIRSLNLN